MALTAKEHGRKQYLSRKLDRNGTLSTPEVRELRTLVKRTGTRGRPKGSKNKKTNLSVVPAVTNATQPSGTNSPQDVSEQHVSIHSTVTLTVNGQEVNVPVEVSIPFRVAEVTVTAL